MVNQIKTILLLGLPGLFFIFLFLHQFGIFEDPIIRNAEKKFSQMNEFSVEIESIDTFTNEKYINVLKKDFGDSYQLFLNAPIQGDLNDIHHYYLHARRKTRRRKHSIDSPLSSTGWEFIIKGGLTVDENFIRIENPLKYRIDKLLKEIQEDPFKRDTFKYKIGSKDELNKSKLTNTYKDLDLSNYNYGKEK